MTHRDDSVLRLRTGDPEPDGAPEARDSPFGRALRERILASDPQAGDGVPTPPPARRRHRRAIGLGAAAAVLAIAGAAIAGVITTREPSPEVQAGLEAALSLPAPDRDELLPLPGGMREELSVETEFGRWVIVSVETRGRGTLISSFPATADGSPAHSDPDQPPGASGGLGGCERGATSRAAPLRLCGMGVSTGSLPQLVMTGRHWSGVAGISAKLGDGRVVSAHMGPEYHLFVVGEASTGPITIVARDGSGNVISARAVSNPLDSLPHFPPASAADGG